LPHSPVYQIMTFLDLWYLVKGLFYNNLVILIFRFCLDFEEITDLILQK